MSHLVTRLCSLAIAGLLLSPLTSHAGERLRVVATFTILADMAKEIGGDHIQVTSLIGPNTDPHSFEPTPQDSASLAKADLVIANGVSLEPWLGRLIAASGAKPHLVIASEGLTPNLAVIDGKPNTPDPHLWQDVRNARAYAKKIAEALEAADQSERTFYAANLARYDQSLAALDQMIRTSIAALPSDRRKIVTNHDAFFYFGKAYGLTLIAPLSLSAEAEPSAKDVAAVITQIRVHKIPAVFFESSMDPRLITRIAQESGAKLGGTLYSDALSDEKGPAGSYIAMMETNIRELTRALAP